MFNAEKVIVQCLEPLLRMRERNEIEEILVVDDCSTDNSAEVVSRYNVRTIQTAVQGGPAAARNHGALEINSDIIWLVDSDVIVADDAALEVSAGFAEDDIGAVFGSYDDEPGANNFLSQYKNLVHHYYHQLGQEEASTFWAGCGAIRRDVYDQVHGFDAKQFPYPSVEDIELGNRIRRAGFRIRLVPGLQGKHLKEWRFINLVHTEVFRRAIPWSRLMLGNNDLINDLNVGTSERLRALLAGFSALTVIGSIAGIFPVIYVFLMFLMIVISNLRLAKFFYSRRGIIFTARALAFHQLYYLYSSAAFVFVFIEQRIFRRSYSE